MKAKESPRPAHRSKSGISKAQKPRGFDAQIWANLGPMQKDVLAKLSPAGQLLSPQELGLEATSSRIVTTLRGLVQMGLVEHPQHGLYCRKV
jgi:hypothetical protein